MIYIDRIDDKSYNELMPFKQSSKNYEQLLLDLAKKVDLSGLSLRKIGQQIGLDNQPQTVKYYLSKLAKSGHHLLNNSSVNFNSIQEQLKPNLVSIPYKGQANCGIATCIADENSQSGYLHIADNLLQKKDTSSIFAVKAIGNSMNKAKVPTLNNKISSIDDGDFVLVDRNYFRPQNGDYVLSIIDNCANIKKLKIDRASQLIYLVSESTENHLPIVINVTDNYFLNGKVIKVIKLI